MTLTLLRAGVLVIYALALLSLVGVLPAGVGPAFPRIAGVMFAVHVIELVFFFKHVRRYQGPLATSVLLTLVFGVLHWKPLADAHAHARGAGA